MAWLAKVTLPGRNRRAAIVAIASKLLADGRRFARMRVQRIRSCAPNCGSPDNMIARHVIEQHGVACSRRWNCGYCSYG